MRKQPNRRSKQEAITPVWLGDKERRLCHQTHQMGGGTMCVGLAGAGALRRSSHWAEMPFEAEGWRSWHLCLFLPSRLGQEVWARESLWEQGAGGGPGKGAKGEMTFREN